ncbi:MAG: pyridoxal-phosphate dependent enzyme [Acidilobaceae archaeon]
MSFKTYDYTLFCTNCRRTYSNIVLSCPNCGSLTIFKYHNARFEINKRMSGIWRYKSLLPTIDKIVSKGEGLTPINTIDSVLVKNERYNPTGSYSDRASSIIASYILSKKTGKVITRFEEDFTYSLVYYLTGISRVTVIVDDPLYLNYSDISILTRVGNVELVSTSEDLSVGVLNYVNPLTVEGLKTIAFELYERRVKVENIVVPAVRGLLAYSIWKGFRDLEESGLSTSYNIVATTIKGYSNIMPSIRESFKVVEVSRDEVLAALLELGGKGVITKPLSISAFIIAKSLGNSIAILTIGFRPPPRKHWSIGARREIIRILEEYGESTAYEVWKNLPVYTLRGVYRALKAMEEKGEVCSEFKTRGNRKVKYYKVC